MRRGFYLLTVFALCFFCVVSCKKTDSEQKEPHVSQEIYRGLHVGEITPIKGDNLEGVKWYTSSLFVSKIDSKQCIIPEHVGFSISTPPNTDSNYVVVEVVPKYEDYDLPLLCTTRNYEGITYDDFPYFDRYIGVTDFKTLEKRTLDPKSSGNIINALLVYRTENIKSPYVVYSFENGVLKTSGTLIDPAYIDNLPEFLKERYEEISVDVSKPAAYFIHKQIPSYLETTEYIDYVGGLQYYSQLGGILLVFTSGKETKSLLLNFLDELACRLEEMNISLNKL